MKKRLLTVLLIATMTLVTSCSNATEVPTGNDTTATTVSITEQITEQATESQTELPTEKEKHENIDGYEYTDFSNFVSLEGTYKKIYTQGIVEKIEVSKDFKDDCILTIATNDKKCLATFSFVTVNNNVKKILSNKEVTCFGTYIGWDSTEYPTMNIHKVIIDGKTYTGKDLKSKSTEPPTPEPTQPPTEKIINESDNSNYQTYDNPQQQNTTSYVLNTHTKKVHKSSCSDVKRISPENYATTDDLNQALADGYSPCQRCNP